MLIAFPSLLSMHQVSFCSLGLEFSYVTIAGKEYSDVLNLPQELR